MCICTGYGCSVFVCNGGASVMGAALLVQQSGSSCHRFVLSNCRGKYSITSLVPVTRERSTGRDTNGFLLRISYFFVCIFFPFFFWLYFLSFLAGFCFVFCVVFCLVWLLLLLYRIWQDISLLICILYARSVPTTADAIMYVSSAAAECVQVLADDCVTCECARVHMMCIVHVANTERGYKL